MLILLALPVIVAVAAVHHLLHSYAPTNRLARHMRARTPLCRTAAALMAVAAVLLLAMHAVSVAVVAGAPGWLNLVVLVLAWDAIKMAALALLTFVRRLLKRPGRVQVADEM